MRSKMRPNPSVEGTSSGLRQRLQATHNFNVGEIVRIMGQIL